MRNELTAVVQRDGGWFVATCVEIPGANGQGRTREACIDSLRDAIELILADRREDAIRALPEGAVQEVVIVG